MKQYKYVKQYKKVFLGYVEQYKNEILNNQGKITLQKYPFVTASDKSKFIVNFLMNVKL